MTRPPPPGQPSRRPGLRRRPRPWRIVRATLRTIIILGVGLPLLVGTAAAAGFGVLLFGHLPGTVLKEKPVVSSQPSFMYDAAGNQIGILRKFELTVPMAKSDVPEVLQNALIASEDRKFWTHQGIDPEGLVRAAFTNYQEGEVKQGGSTITQQYVKNTFLTTEKSVSRKLNEAVLATRLERELTDQLGSRRAAKEEILYRYLDTTYFGSGAYGAAAAAETYFRKSVNVLNASEAATLVAIIPAPSRYGPREDLFLAESRRVEVLGEMHDQGMLTDAEFAQAKAAFLWPAGFGDPGGPTTAFYPPINNGASAFPYFFDYTRDYLTAKYGDEVFTGGLKIETTIDPKLQALAEKAVHDNVDSAPAHVNMSMVSVEPSTGFVRTMVGGRDPTLTVNLATGGTQGVQPGSSFKAFTLAAAMEAGFPTSQTYDAGSVYLPSYCKGNVNCPYAIHNSEPGEVGFNMDMYQATAQSVNTYFAPLARDTGPKNVAKLAVRLGITHFFNVDDPNLDEHIGVGQFPTTPLDMAGAYAVFDNHGKKQTPIPVLRVTRADGTVLEDNTDRAGEQVLNPAIADTVTDILRGPINHGTATGQLGNFGRPAVGKTGTTDDNTNAWFVGYTPQLSTAVWMGHDDGVKPLRGIEGFARVYGGDIPARAWGEFMTQAMAGLPALDFPPPGPLPAPGTAGADMATLGPDVRKPNQQTIPQIPSDCDGPCSRAPTLTTPSPPTTSPPATTPATTAPSATTVPSTTTTVKSPPTTKKGHGP